jgi:phosphoglycolate phosphatase-like HAD superfamily hydrolase
MNSIIWDFDGVILNSNEVRDKGFEKVLEHYSQDEIKRLLEFHRANGGLSRYVKFRYFFEEIRDEAISDKEVKDWAGKFSVITSKLLTNSALRIEETIDFIRKNHERYRMFVASGSDQSELRYLCRQHNLDHYFEGVFGSPVAKNDIVNNIIKDFKIDPANTYLIGDSHNDFEAASVNGIKFIGYNNSLIKGLGINYFESGNFPDTLF